MKKITRGVMIRMKRAVGMAAEAPLKRVCVCLERESWEMGQFTGDLVFSEQ